MASGKRLPNESQEDYKTRLRQEEEINRFKQTHGKKMEPELPDGGVTVEERIGQVYSQMLDNAHLLEDDMPEGEGQLWLTLLSYTVHLEARVTDLESQMTNLLASLKMAAELEQKGTIAKPSTEIIIP